MALDAGTVEATLVLDLDDRGFRDGDRKMAEWARKDAHSQLSFDVDDRGFEAADRKLHEWGMKSSTAELKFDVDRASLSRLIAGAGGAGRAIDNVASSAGNANSGLSGLGSSMAGLPWVGIITGAGAALPALVNLGGAAVSVGSALSSLSGLLVTVPQGLLGFAQGAGTVMAATDGISAALKAYETQQTNADKTTQAATQHQTSAAQARAAANRQIVTAQQQVADSNRQLGTAERNLTVQHEQVTQAQHALNLAVEQAQRDMQDLRRQAVEASTSEKQAALNLDAARRALDKGLRDPTTSGLELRQLRLDVTEARQAHTDSHIAATRATQDNNRAQREGVQGMPGVVSARDALTSAVRAEAEAHRQLADAQRSAARATQNLDYQQQQAKLHIEQANQSMASATTTANVYQQALKQLTPAQRQFTRFLVDTQENIEHLRNTAAANLFPGVERGITAALKNFPRLRRIVGDTAQVLGHIATMVGKFLGSRQFGQSLSLFAHTNLRLFDDLARAGLHFAHGLELIMRDAQPFLRWLGRLTERLGSAFNAWARSGHQTGLFTMFFKETRRTLPEVLRLFEHLGSLLAGVGAAAAPVGNKILQFLNRSLRAWAEWSHSIVGQVELRAFFERLRKPFEDLLRLASALGKAFLELFGSSRGQHMLDELTKALIRMIPPVQSIGETLVEILSIIGPSLLNVLNSFLQIIADGAPELEIFAKALAFLANGLVTVIDAVPGLSQLTGTIAAWGVALAGVKWAFEASGIKALGGALWTIVKPGGIIESAPANMAKFWDNFTAFPTNLRYRAQKLGTALKDLFHGIAIRLGLATGETVAEGTVGGEVAGQAGGGLLGRMRGLMGRVRTSLGTMFSAIGQRLGLQLGETAAEGTVGGAAAGEAGGGLIGMLRTKFPRLSMFFERFGGTLGRAFLIGLITLGLFEFHDQIIGFFKDEFDTMRSIGNRLGTALGNGIGNALKTVINDVLIPPLNFFIDRVNNAIDAINVVPGLPNIGHVGHIAPIGTQVGISGHPHLGRGGLKIGGVTIKHPFGRSGGQRGGVVTEDGISGYALGGIAGAVQRPGPTDTVPALLTPGEIVLPKKASQAIQNAVGPITKGTEKATAAILKLIRRDVAQSYVGIVGDVADAEDKLTKQNRDTWQQIRKDTDDAIGTRSGQNGTFWGDVGDAISGVGDTWDSATQKMMNQTQTRFAQIAQTAQRQAQNFSGYVKNAMRDASDATYQGTSYIAGAVTKALKAFDSNTKFHLTVDKPNLAQHAQGGMIGGSGRQDTVPLLLGMAAPGEAILTRYQQGWVEAALRNTFGMGLGDLFSRETRPHGFAKGGKVGGDYVYPFPKGTTLGRTDQGVDLGGVGTPVGAIGAGVVTSLSDYFASSGYPAAGGLVYKLLGGAPKGYAPSSPYIYTFEGLNRRGGLGMGSKLRPGQVFGSIGLGSDTSIEMGWAASGGGQPLAQTSGGPIDPVSHFSPAGQSFTRFLNDLASGRAISASGLGSARIGKIGVHGTAGPLLDLVTAALGMERAAANADLAQHSRVSGPAGFSVPTAKGSLARRAGTIARKLKAPHRAALALFEALWAESSMGQSSSNVLQLIPQTAASAGIGLTDADAQIASFLQNAYGFGPGAIQLAKTTNEPAYAIAQDIQGSGAGQSSGGRSNYGAAAGEAAATLHQLGYPSFREGGFIGRLESRLRRLTKIPAVRHLHERLRHLQAQMRSQGHRLKGLGHDALHGAPGRNLRSALHTEAQLRHQIAEHLHTIQKGARARGAPIQQLQQRLAGRLLSGFERAENIADRGGNVQHLLNSLHVGRGVGSPMLRSFAKSRSADIRNALSISRAQAPSLGGGSIFAQGGFLGSGLGLTNVSGAAQQAPIYLMLDADVAGFVGRVRAVQNGREVELARKAGLGRMTPGSIGRKAVYSLP